MRLSPARLALACAGCLLAVPALAHPAAEHDALIGLQLTLGPTELHIAYLADVPHALVRSAAPGSEAAPLTGMERELAGGLAAQADGRPLTLSVDQPLHTTGADTHVVHFAGSFRAALPPGTQQLTIGDSNLPDARTYRAWDLRVLPGPTLTGLRIGPPGATLGLREPNATPASQQLWVGLQPSSPLDPLQQALWPSPPLRTAEAATASQLGTIATLVANRRQPLTDLPPWLCLILAACWLRSAEPRPHPAKLAPLPLLLALVVLALPAPLSPIPKLLSVLSAIVALATSAPALALALLAAAQPNPRLALPLCVGLCLLAWRRPAAPRAPILLLSLWPLYTALRSALPSG